MVLVDTTVWIDFFCNKSTSQVIILENIIKNDVNLCVCGVILTEILQGIRSDVSYRKTKKYFESLLFLPMERETFLKASEIYRALRKKGVTVRKPIDCMIASVAIENNLPLLHHDRDFDQIAKYTNLKVVKSI